MECIKNDIGVFYSDEDISHSISRLCALIKDFPHILTPVRGLDERVKRVCSERGFRLYPTVKRTTLLYEEEADCFFKILHPLNLKSRLQSLFVNRAENIYRLSERLTAEGFKIARVVAYGTLRMGRMPIYVMDRVEGRSLYEILIRDKRPLKMELYQKVMNEVARLHKLGYWFGDAHLSHIFVNNSEISGFIDIDGIRRNMHFSIKNMAKDLASLNYPGIPITANEKRSLLDHYINISGIDNKEKFLRLLKHYTQRRWKRHKDQDH